MTMWLVIMYVTLMLTAGCLLYLSGKVGGLSVFQKRTDETKKRHFLIGALVVFSLFGLLCLVLNTMNAIVCALYLAMIWALCETSAFLIGKIFKKTFKKDRIGMTALCISLLCLFIGWYQAHHVWQTEYVLETDKKIKDAKIIMFADAHIGTTFDAKGFAGHIARMQSQEPDIVIISGDFVDDDTSRQDMIESCRSLGQMKTTYGVYLVLGNHDKGYYDAARRGFSEQDLIAELEKNGVTILKDDTVLIADSFYLIGRKDFSVEKERKGKRQSMTELVENLDRSKYILVADHQPADYKNQTQAKVDLVLSGHTHGGQLFPFNRVGKWIGANDKIYGFEKRGNTNYIVTSGISDWAIKFKTGCRSEYVMLYLKQRGGVSDKSE